jgi:hypothetical protein
MWMIDALALGPRSHAVMCAMLGSRGRAGAVDGARLLVYFISSM